MEQEKKSFSLYELQTLCATALAITNRIKYENFGEKNPQKTVDLMREGCEKTVERFWNCNIVEFILESVDQIEMNLKDLENEGK